MAFFPKRPRISSIQSSSFWRRIRFCASPNMSICMFWLLDTKLIPVTVIARTGLSQRYFWLNSSRAACAISSGL